MRHLIAVLTGTAIPGGEAARNAEFSGLWGVAQRSPKDPLK